MAEDAKKPKTTKSAEEKILADGTEIEVADSPEAAGKDKPKNKQKQVRYIFMEPGKGWYEKEKDNVRITKYYKTQKEAIESARKHIKNSGMAGSIVIQSKAGKIRANSKVAKKK